MCCSLGEMGSVSVLFSGCNGICECCFLGRCFTAGPSETLQLWIVHFSFKAVCGVRVIVQRLCVVCQSYRPKAVWCVRVIVQRLCVV